LESTSMCDMVRYGKENTVKPLFNESLGDWFFLH
jgi:hypothetical protein